MIFTTVGMQLSFDRLIEAMDKLAPHLDHKVTAQSGVGRYKAANFHQHGALAPQEFEDAIARADLIVSHAGIGSILTASRYAKPIVLVPRRADLGEHRNDHQLATCRQLAGRPGIITAFDTSELPDAIAKGLSTKAEAHEKPLSAIDLESAIARFIQGGLI